MYINMRTLIIILLLVASVCVESVELNTKSYTILIDISKLVADGWNLEQIKTKGHKLIRDAAGQPFKMTSWFKAPNTNYFIINVVPKTSSEVDWFIAAKQKDIAKLISSSEVITKPSRFGNIKILKKVKINNLPSNYNIGVSTQ